MLIQISSGTGPIECEIAVDHFFHALIDEYGKHHIQMLNRQPSRCSDGAKSILLETDLNLSELAGTVQWIWKTTLRPGHKRRNWFIDISVIPDVEEINFDNKDISIEFFHAGGNGGQNINKVETGVRLTHIPTGTVTESTKERTQQANRRDALEKMIAEFKKMREEALAGQKNYAWSRHTELERGNPVRTYKGEKFKRVLN